MVKFRYILLVSIVLTLVGCHRKKEAPQDVDTTEISMVEDKCEQKGEDTIATAEKDEDVMLQMQNDTAVRTDWRSFARKQSKIYSPSLLPGVWKNGTLHQQYRSDGTGLRWDENDDVSRTEGMVFSWVMDSNCLTMIFPMKMGGVVPKEYVVTYADDESLVYKDAYGTSYMWDKVPQDMNLELQ